MINPYSLEEKKIVAKYVKKYPGNLTLAFSLAAKVIGRSKESVSTHWYTTLRNEGRVFKLPKTVTNKKNVKFTQTEVTRKMNRVHASVGTSTTAVGLRSFNDSLRH